MIRINLLPVREAQRKERLRSQLSILVLSLIATCLICAGLYTAKAVEIDSLKDKNAAVKKEIRELNKKIGAVDRLKKMQADLEKKLKVLATLKANKKGPVHLLDEVSLSLPEKLWLTSYSRKGDWIDIAGVGINEPTVAAFMRNLEESPYYQDIELKVTSQTVLNGLKLQKFSLVARVEDPNEQSEKPESEK